jgi:hypothetical protein
MDKIGSSVIGKPKQPKDDDIPPFPVKLSIWKVEIEDPHTANKKAIDVKAPTPRLAVMQLRKQGEKGRILNVQLVKKE